MKSAKKLQFEDLRPELQSLLDEAFSKLKIARGDIDTCVYDSLMDFPEPVQDEIVVLILWMRQAKKHFY